MFISDLFLYPVIFQVGSSGIYPVYNRWDWKNMLSLRMIPIIFLNEYCKNKHLKLAALFVFADYNVILHCVVWYGYLSWLCLCVRLILIPFFSNACELLYFAGIVLCITYWNYFQSSWLVRSISPRNEITLFLNRMFNDIKWAYTTTYVQYRFKP